MDNKDLETFRKNWINELTHSNSRPQVGDKAEFDNDIIPNVLNDDNEIEKKKKDKQNNAPPHSDQNEIDCGEKFLVVNNIINEDSNSNSGGYYPFVLLGEMLKSGSQEYSPPNIKKHQQQNITSPPILKRKYFDHPDISGSSSTDNEHSDNADKCDSGPTGSLKHGTKKLPVPVMKKPKQESNSRSENYLDLFVKDLDEINEIPFFDTSLAREVAVKIFQYLSIQDLCNCSQVSKSWRSLADDELLWCQICHRLGYEAETSSVEKLGWKKIVQRYVERRKTLITNWKGRIGKYHQLQHVQGGILTAVHSFQDTIVAGYTNCDIKVWTMNEDDNMILKSSNTALIIDESLELGTVSNQVQQVQTSGKYTAASYTHGFVDIWCNDNGTEPVYTLNTGKVRNISLSYSEPVLAISTYNSVSIVQLHNSEYNVLDQLQIQNVDKLKWLESGTGSHVVKNDLILSNQSKVCKYETGSGNVVELYNTVDTNIRCIETQLDLLAIGIHFLSPVAEHKIKLYDLNKNEIQSTLHGHTWYISCLHLPPESPHIVVSGSGDRKVRQYDLRSGNKPIQTIIGHTGSISTVQLDEWKIVSSDVAGFVTVRDTRTYRKLWELHNRHPVEYCRFYDRYLTVGNIPINKTPQIDSEFETSTHRKYRGTVQVYDFLSDQQRDNLPDICQSTYDTAPAYNFNIRLATPYDNL